MIKTPEEILKEVANNHSYNTWGEAIYDTHPHTQVEYAVEAMQAYHSQFPSPQEVTQENCVHPYSDVYRKVDYEKCTKCGKVLCEG